MLKIAILGYSGSGKSTLARYLAETLELPLLHLDTIQFTSDWEERDRKEAREMVADFLLHDSWVIDGNYASFLQKERLNQADKIIYLQFSRWTCLKRVLQRFKKYHGQSRPDITEGCTEKIDLPFIWWILYEGRSKKMRQQFTEALEPHQKKTIYLHNQKELDAFYNNVLTDG